MLTSELCLPSLSLVAPLGLLRGRGVNPLNPRYGDDSSLGNTCRPLIATLQTTSVQVSVI